MNKQVVANVASGSNEYMVTYNFSPRNGELLTNKVNIPWSLWKELQIGTSIEVAFDPTYPAKNFPVYAGIAEDVVGSLIISVIFTVVFPVVIFYVLRILRLKRTEL